MTLFLKVPWHYLQVFNLYAVDSVQIVKHSLEQPEYEMLYVFPEIDKPITAKVYVIDSDDYCTMCWQRSIDLGNKDLK